MGVVVVAVVVMGDSDGSSGGGDVMTILGDGASRGTP